MLAHCVLVHSPPKKVLLASKTISTSTIRCVEIGAFLNENGSFSDIVLAVNDCHLVICQLWSLCHIDGSVSVTMPLHFPALYCVFVQGTALTCVNLVSGTLLSAVVVYALMCLLCYSHLTLINA